MRDTLVLNASFEPLSTVTLNRAVVLVLQDKAVVEQAHPELRMRGAAVDIPAPRVIRLTSSTMFWPISARNILPFLGSQPKR